jgi:hypothetical protein
MVADPESYNIEKNDVKAAPVERLVSFKLWRDLEVGEEIKVGDRCCGSDHKWFEMKDEHLSFADKVSNASYPIQRCVEN